MANGSGQPETGAQRPTRQEGQQPSVVVLVSIGTTAHFTTVTLRELRTRVQRTDELSPATAPFPLFPSPGGSGTSEDAEGHQRR